MLAAVAAALPRPGPWSSTATSPTGHASRRSPAARRPPRMTPPSTPRILPRSDAARSTSRPRPSPAASIVGLPTETVYGLAVAAAAGAARGARGGQATAAGQGHRAAHRRPGPGRRPRGAARRGASTRGGLLAGGADAGPAAAARACRCRTCVTGGRTTLGVRLPDHAVPRALARRLGPLAVSSANRSGEPDARTAGGAAGHGRGRRSPWSSTTDPSGAASRPRSWRSPPTAA